MEMHVGAVIPTVNRHDSLRRAIQALENQTYPVDQIVISAPTEGGVPPEVRQNPAVTVVTGTQGASRQRNAGVAALAPEIEAVVFLDDDSVPRDDFVKAVVAVFQDDDVVAVTGRMACDGAAEGREIPVPELMESLEASRADDGLHVSHPVNALYGCNMAIRRVAIVRTPFDERLPLYSWLEDLDVARRVRGLGGVVYDSRCVVAHQGNNSGGRTQHLRFGYSSIANPLYLTRKGSLTFRDLPRLIGRPFLGNVRGAWGREGESRRQRLKGQLLAVGDIMRGRSDPSRITAL